MAYHDEYLELISAALDGALSLQETDRLEAHLAQCPDCKALYDQLWVATKAVKGLPPVEPPADLTDRIMAAVQADNVTPITTLPKRKQPWGRWLTSAAVLAVLLAGGYGITQNLGINKSAAPVYALQSTTDDAQPASVDSVPANDAASEGGDARFATDGYFDTKTYGYPDTEDSQTDSSSADYNYISGSKNSQSTSLSPETITADGTQKPLSAPTDSVGQASVPSYEQSTASTGGPSESGGSNSAPHVFDRKETSSDTILSSREAMELVVNQVYGNSGRAPDVEYSTDGTASVCQLSADGTVVSDTQGHLEYQGLSPNGTYYLFFWSWEGQTAEEAPRFRYAVSLDGSHIIWAGALEDGDTFQTIIND